MSKMQRRQSQVSQDFSITLNAYIQTAIETDRGQNLRIEPSFGRSVSSKLSNDERISLNTNFTTENQNEENIDYLTQPVVSQKDERKNTRYFNIPNYIKSLFVGNIKYIVPFESTSIYHMPYALTIILESQEKLYVKIRNYHTIDRIISVISKKKSLIPKEISLYYEGTRLEDTATVSFYGIKPKINIYMKILKKIRINGRYSNKGYPIYIYTSEMIIDIKELFSIETEIDSDMMQLTYDDIILEDTKYAHVYNLKENDVIYITAIGNENSDELSVETNPGLEIVRRYIKMTNSLETCSCKERRQNEIAYIILSMFNKKFKRRGSNILNEFDKNLHHISCFKSKPTESTCSSVSTSSQSNESEISTDDISLDDCILAEIQRVDKKKKIIIEERDLQILCNVNSFKDFKHILKARIGTKCNLRSVAMLYKYALEMVVYIGAEEENNSNVKTILNNIKSYFQNYFEREIIAKGGMSGLALTDSDIED